MAFLEISNWQKDYAGNRVVESFNLAVEQGEFISFLGPSGCGKPQCCGWSQALKRPVQAVFGLMARM